MLIVFLRNGLSRDQSIAATPLRGSLNEIEVLEW